MADNFLPKLVPLGDQNWQGGTILAAKIGPAGPILAAKVVRGTTFGRFFCQNRSGQTDFGVTALTEQVVTLTKQISTITANQRNAHQPARLLVCFWCNQPGHVQHNCPKSR